ncbi:FecCD family ABC transporter permease [Phytopseudomonas dryadis]|uniref:ABC transporter permease n=1 Tax=Phytopseudomonas dryadis TaxID=2487520 RepID=A0A4Q9QXZ8_9GAMM|nr:MULTISPECIES: iron ABC transporter permease [Pseudomonas]TBU90014.1 ABC transporter permease [Pseudomonas dryadis]TBV02650.1 ABC transporter permease [Pseudomonas dryadis]TBV15502.1 ABC transporter permease [Pseudomonas sp. FRB 230]
MIAAGKGARLPLSRALALCVGLLLALCLASLLIGAGEVGVLRSAQALFATADGEARFVLFELRLPRTLLGVLAGVALGAAGVVLQSATRNPLAEPGLLGVSAGASFAVVLAISLGASAATLNLGVAIAGALVGCLLVLLVTQVRGVGDDPVRLVLAGAAFSGILTAISTLILLHDQRSADEIRFWIIGALAGRPQDVLTWSTPGLLLGLAILLPLIRPLSALALGEKMATGLGHHPALTRLGALLGVAVLVGTATAAAGPIAFVGLVVPFVARRLVGPDIRRTIGLSLLLGPSIILFADILSRLLVSPYELPIGVVTALIGAPVLIAVVRGHRMPTL